MRHCSSLVLVLWFILVKVHLCLWKIGEQTLYQWKNVYCSETETNKSTPHCHTFILAVCCSPKVCFLHINLNPCVRTSNRHSINTEFLEVQDSFFFFLLYNTRLYTSYMAACFLHDKKSQSKKYSYKTECIYLLSVWIKDDS